MRSLLPLLLALGASAVAAPLQTFSHPNAKWAFHMDSRRAVAVDYDRAAAVLLPRQGSPRVVKFSSNGKLRSPLVTPEGRVLAVGLDFEKCQVVVWDVTAGKAVAPLRGDFTRIFGCGDLGGTEFIFSTQFTPEGRFLLTQDAAGLRRWDARNGKLLKALPGTFLNLSVSPDGRTVAALGQNRKVEVWTSDLTRRLKAAPQQPADCFRGAGAWPSGVAWSPDSLKLAFSCDREVRVWNVQAGGLRGFRRDQKVDAPDAPVFSPDGRFVVSNEDQFGVAVWNVGSGQRVTQVKMPAQYVGVTDVKVALNNILFAALDNGHILRMNLTQPTQALEPLRPFPDKTRLWLTLAVSPEGDRLLAASGDGRLNVYALPEK